VIHIGIIVKNGKIIIHDSIPLMLGMLIWKEYMINLTQLDQNGIGVIPLHKGNIEYIRIQYENIRDLFKIDVNSDSKFVINLKATICNCELVIFENTTFLDVFCKDQWKLQKKIHDFHSKEDGEGLFSYLRGLVGNEIIDNYRKNKV